jgi:hypothetical protein
VISDDTPYFFDSTLPRSGAGGCTEAENADISVTGVPGGSGAAMSSAVLTQCHPMKGGITPNGKEVEGREEGREETVRRPPRYKGGAVAPFFMYGTQ